MHLSKALLASFGFAAAFATEVVLAQENENFSMSVGTDFRHYENANYTTVEDDEISEFQARAFVGAQGRVETNRSLLLSDLKVEARSYEEQDTQNDVFVIGEIDYSLGKEDAPVSLNARYSSEEVYVDPLEGDSPNNKDTRGIASIALIGRTPTRNANSLTAFLRQSEVIFNEFDENNSSRLEASVRYARRVSPLTTTGLYVSNSDVKFEANDRESEILTALWYLSSDLRRTYYEVELGQDWYESDVSDGTSLNLHLAAGARLSGQTIGFDARQWTSDTSIGDGNSGGFDNLTGQDGRLGVVDQYLNKEAALTWESANMCRGCVASVGLLFHREDYKNLSQFDTTETNLNFRGSYQARPNWGIGMQVLLADVEFPEGGFASYTEERVGFSVQSDHFRNVELTGFLNVTHRRFSDTDSDYFSSYVGISLAYLFYQR